MLIEERIVWMEKKIQDTPVCILRCPDGERKRSERIIENIPLMIFCFTLRTTKFGERKVGSKLGIPFLGAQTITLLSLSRLSFLSGQLSFFPIKSRAFKLPFRQPASSGGTRFWPEGNFFSLSGTKSSPQNILMRQVQIFSAGLSPHLGEGEEKRLAPQDLWGSSSETKRTLKGLGGKKKEGSRKRCPNLD